MFVFNTYYGIRSEKRPRKSLHPNVRHIRSVCDYGAGVIGYLHLWLRF